VKIEQAIVADHSAILELNEAALPHVNRISGADLARFAAESFSLRVARQQGAVAGFLLSFSQDAAYESPNFLWFRARYPRFVYIDRAVVAPAFRRSGVGRRLYADLDRSASPIAPHLACEVNLQPPNPGSLSFHESLGFVEVGRQHTDGGEKLVCLMLKKLSSTSS
jgi:predicted GNAT superfamily acetyltransferase